MQKPACSAESWFRSLGQEDSLEEEMATHSSILAWQIPWTEQPNKLWGCKSQTRPKRLNHHHTSSNRPSHSFLYLSILALCVDTFCYNLFFFFLIWGHCTAEGILCSLTKDWTEPIHLAWKAQNPNHWTTMNSLLQLF